MRSEKLHKDGHAGDSAQQLNIADEMTTAAHESVTQSNYRRVISATSKMILAEVLGHKAFSPEAYQKYFATHLSLLSKRGSNDSADTIDDVSHMNTFRIIAQFNLRWMHANQKLILGEDEYLHSLDVTDEVIVGDTSYGRKWKKFLERLKDKEDQVAKKYLSYLADIPSENNELAGIVQSGIMRGVCMNEDAIKWLVLSVKAGNTPTVLKLAEYYKILVDKNDDFQALYCLATMYANKEELIKEEEDYEEKAKGYFMRLGLAFEDGKLEFNEHGSLSKIASFWYKKAADLGYAPAQFSLGRLIYEREIPPYHAKSENQEAFTWFEKASKQGDCGALHAIGRMYEDGHIEVKRGEDRYELSAKWYLKAAEQGNPASQVNYVRMIMENQISLPDGKDKFEVAGFWLSQAAEHGSAEAQFTLGILIEKRKVVLSVDQDVLQQAHDWYLKSANQNFGPAQYQMALFIFKSTFSLVGNINKGEVYEIALAWIVRAEENSDISDIKKEIQELKQQIKCGIKQTKNTEKKNKFKDTQFDHKKKDNSVKVRSPETLFSEAMNLVKKPENSKHAISNLKLAFKMGHQESGLWLIRIYLDANQIDAADLELKKLEHKKNENLSEKLSILRRICSEQLEEKAKLTPNCPLGYRNAILSWQRLARFFGKKDELLAHTCVDAIRRVEKTIEGLTHYSLADNKKGGDIVPIYYRPLFIEALDILCTVLNFFQESIYKGKKNVDNNELVKMVGGRFKSDQHTLTYAIASLKDSLDLMICDLDVEEKTTCGYDLSCIKFESIRRSIRVVSEYDILLSILSSNSQTTLDSKQLKSQLKEHFPETVLLKDTKNHLTSSARVFIKIMTQFHEKVRRVVGFVELPALFKFIKIPVDSEIPFTLEGFNPLFLHPIKLSLIEEQANYMISVIKEKVNRISNDNYKEIEKWIKVFSSFMRVIRPHDEMFFKEITSILTGALERHGLEIIDRDIYNNLKPLPNDNLQRKKTILLTLQRSMENITKIIIALKDPYRESADALVVTLTRKIGRKKDDVMALRCAVKQSNADDQKKISALPLVIQRNLSKYPSSVRADFRFFSYVFQAVDSPSLVIEGQKFFDN